MKQIGVETQTNEAQQENNKTSQSKSQNQTNHQQEQQATSSSPTMEAKRERLKRRMKHTSNQSAYQRLVEACKSKHLATIKSIINEQPELVNQKDKQNRSLLHYASILVLNNNNNNNNNSSTSSNYELNSDEMIIDQELANKCIECFDYLTSRCELKLWWQQDYDGLSILHLAVISSNVPLVKHMVFEHPYSMKFPLICTLDNESHSPLHWAVITNNLDCVKLLVNYAGTKLAHEPDLNGATPLHYATQTRDYPKYKQQLKHMLKNVGQETTNEQASTQSNSSVQYNEPITSPTTTTTSASNTTSTSYGKSSTKKFGRESSQCNSSSQDLDNQSRILNIVSDQLRGLEILEYLVKLPGINLECKDKDHRTPLLWAASSGNCEAIVLLINHGSDLASFDINRLSALHCAASHGYTDCVECLLSLDSASAAGQVNQVDNLNCTPLFYSVLSGNIDCIEILLDRGAKQDWQDTKGRTAAHFAALKGQLNSLKLLQKRGSNLWLPNKQGDLPLHYAIKSGRQQVAKWLLENSPYAHSVNAINNFGRSPIHLAIMKNNLEMVDYLIKCGANLNQLVKVRDRTSKPPAATSSGVLSTDHQQLTLVNNSNTHQNKNGSSYRYETALDMAKKLNHGQCLQLLIENQALSAAQVIRNRANGAPLVMKTNTNSLFDIQSIEGPSPIGFETSYSSSGNSPNMNQLVEIGRIPKLSRPAPDTLPQSDSTASSALSHNSLTSIRGEPEQLKEVIGNKQTFGMHSSCGKQNISTNLQHPSEQDNVKQQNYSDYDNDRRKHQEAEERDADKPSKGGISYNNEHFNASIKYKLYEQDRESGLRHFNHRSFPTQNESRARPQKSINGRAILSAPQDQQQNQQRGQEIITNVNVYTASPCPHCAHFNSDLCSVCHKVNSRQLDTSATRQESSIIKQQQQLTKNKPFEDGFYSDETSETATTASGETEQEMLNTPNKLPNLAASGLPLVQPHSVSINNNSYDSAVGSTTFKRYLPPSQNHEQHLPVIISDQEQSTSAGISPESPQIDSYDTADRQQQQQRQMSGSRFDNVVSDGDTDTKQQHDGGAEHKSPALQEPRFDRSRRYRGGQHVDRYRQQVRSPIADYIHAPFGSGHFAGDHARPVSLNRDENTRHCPLRTDYSQVKAKVDSHRLHYDDPIRSKSMSMLQHHHQPYSRSPYHGMYVQQPPRSISRQTVIRRRNSGSVDSLELTTKIEKSIRKHRQEAKIFEELQNLKRSQIRSGRANEALLVKRLVDHFSQDTFNLIGLDASYHGPYTYQSYERFLYDQLRKLSQSNCVKLSAQMGDESQYPSSSSPNLKIDHQQQQHQQQQYRNIKFPETAIANGSPTISHSDQHFLEEDMKAELELQRVINGDVVDELAGEQKDGETSRAGIKSVDRERIHDSEVEKVVEKLAEETSSAQINQERGVGEGTEEKLNGGDIGGYSRGEIVTSREASTSSRSSSRRSSVDIEREKLMNLPLTTRGQQQAYGLEEEARSLSSSIIVDALGNVSRVGSASRRISTEKSSETSVSNMANDTSDSGRSGDATKEGLDHDDEEPEPKPMTSSRRRSVVNIGNKMEVIYHDVGIEIDSAVDSDNSAGAERIRNLVESQDRQKVESSKFGDDDEGLENVIEDAVEDSDDKQIEHEQEEGQQQQQQQAPSETSEVEKVIESTSEEFGETEESVADTVVDTHSLNPRDSLKSSDSNIVRTSSRSSAASSTRRVSSPPAFLIKEDAKLLDSNIANLSRSQRASSIGPELRGGDIVKVKKVFNGYDLDEMHKKSTQLSELSPQKSRTSSEEKATQFTDGNDDSNNSEIDEKPDYITSEARRRSSLVGRQQQVLSVEQETDKMTTLESSMRHRARRLPRSRLIKGKYVVNVPIEDVRERWSRIKAAERRRKLRIERSLLSDDVAEQFELMGNISRPTRHLSSGDEDRLPNFTKLQQNLKTGSMSQSIMNESESMDKEGANWNFELLYEINKSSKLTSSEAKSKQRDTTKLKWCHKKAVKIVDVRTIKRTLSLPESLIYSNDLLKRFNILKL